MDVLSLGAAGACAAQGGGEGAVGITEEMGQSRSGLPLGWRPAKGKPGEVSPRGLGGSRGQREVPSVAGDQRAVCAGSQAHGGAAAQQASGRGRLPP